MSLNVAPASSRPEAPDLATRSATELASSFAPGFAPGFASKPAGSRRYTLLLAACGLDVAISGQAVTRNLNFELQPGECLVLLGRNGVGKTTLLHTLAGLRAPEAGTIQLAGKTYADHGPRGAARLRGLLPQQQGDAFAASVLETVLIGRHPHLSRWDWESAADEQLAREALADVGLADLAARSIHTLSGGERQRVALATLLVQQPNLYLLDEPLAHLDLNHQIAVLDLIRRRVRETGAALVMVLHDVNLAARYSDRALLLHGAGEQELGNVADLFDAPRLSRLYGYPLRVIVDGERRWFVPEVCGNLDVLQADIDQGVADIQAGKVREADIESIQQRGRAVLAERAKARE
jgi:iron complex transport system ATP-binding protein